ncbi:molybdenum cofactor guanylyltransferase MobA [Pacificibacter marinus]|uniref:Molybdenum cofactor guanylyltransferase n=1 Tax=Pacificibacter marinus TaxID=658057 RepID=A0A1Y5S8V8_9RHOB|nr:molybdenum cofactor guanylyltransferase MobA [Pacificibacter marinus]SEK76711.1 molybdenum cofactor guanylyltransferase [Pacificibacter marinus]SLN34443.1 Molybdenum cofactor guanylyltransferase [Pacificibacter marinus]
MTLPAAVILAGGCGTRLGGLDKALCTLNGRSFLAHCQSRLAPQCGLIALNANGDTRRFHDTKLPIISDSVQDSLGPLSGILTAMEWAASNGYTQVLTIAVDTPFFPMNLAQRLLQKPHDQIALAATRDTNGHLWLHPTFAIWPTSLHEKLRMDLEHGARKVTAWAKAQGAVNIIFETQANDPFFNINTPEDLVRAEQIVKSQTRADQPR